MTTLTLAQSEIFDRLRVNLAELDGIAADRAKRLETFMEAEGQAQAREAMLRKQNDDLQIKLRELTVNSEIPPVSLAFYDTERLVRWAGGEIRLGKKPYRFVQALYRTSKKRMTVDNLIVKVWGNVGMTLSSKTIRSTVSQLKTTLQNAKFPYQIIKAQCKRQRIERTNPKTGRIDHITVRAQTTGYILRVKTD